MLCLVSPSVTWYGLVAVKEPGTKPTHERTRAAAMGQTRHTSWGTAHLVHTKYTTNAWELQPFTKEATRDGAICHAQSSSVCGPAWVNNTTVVNPHAQMAK